MMRLSTRPTNARMVAVLAAASLCGIAAGQVSEQDAPPPQTASAEPAAEAAPTLPEMQRELRKIRAKYLGSMRNQELRQIGIAKIREFTDPVIFPDLLEIFAREKEDVRTAILDHLLDQKNDQADASLAWAAMFDKQEWFRKAALERLKIRTEEEGKVPERVQWAVAAGLKRETTEEIGRAAELAADLKLFDAIPMLINLQVRGSGASVGSGGGGGGAGGDLAYIMIGRQVAFVSDLQPVVGDSAVAFDPELSVVTEGVVMRVQGATVYTYRVAVHNALVRLADAGWDGRSTASLGYDKNAWREWYLREFVPYRERLAAAEAARKQAAETPKSP